MSETEKRALPIKPVIFVLLIAICFLVVRFTPIKDELSLSEINSHLSLLIEFFNRPYGPAVFVGLTVLIILLQVPGLTMAVVGGYVYDVWLGFILSLTGATIGVTLTFLIARYFLRDYFRPKLNSSVIGKYIKGLENTGLLSTVFLRILMTMAPPLNWFLGATNLRVRHYVVGSFLGMAPMVFITVFMVNRLRHIESMSDLMRPEIIAVLAVFGILFIGILIFRKRFTKDEDQESAKQG